MGEQEEPLPGHTTIIKTLFALKLDEEPLLEIVSLKPHNLVKGFLKEVLAGHGHLDITLFRGRRSGF